jgi:hypothetical protein
VEQHGNTLYLGSLTAPRFAAYPLPANDPATVIEQDARHVTD